ncbi:uncharacterized protein LOC124289691 [Haliotis rubra]|uniref:uncharacterized protein LOC124289691 n=1 Tax=Haliotis rubra TaxID=36100 RepID=UPI001EE505EE|nr:uncharacterized protein LOC124289691 [Haliotis rubra]
MKLVAIEREGSEADTRVLSAIPEIIERSMSYTPGRDPNKGTADASSYAVTDVTADSITQRHISFPSECREGPTCQMDKEEESVIDHIFNLSKEHRKEIQEMGRQLRLEQKRNAKLRKELNHYRLECNNYKVSWMMDQAELEDLQAKLHGMDNYPDEIKNTEAQMKGIEDENKKLRKSLSQVHCDNKALRKLMNMTDMQIHMEKPRVDEEMGGTFVPRLPSCCVGGRRGAGRRRQHTRKLRGVLTTVLPPVSENNKIVGSPQQTTPSLARRASMGNICPRTIRRDTSSRRQPQSGVPLSSAMSSESVPRGRVRHRSSWK